MSTADLMGQSRARGTAPTPRCGTAVPDYHALGTFAETWAFLDLFLDRCAGLVGGACGQDPGSLSAKLEALEVAARVAPMLKDFSSEISVLTADIRALADTRQVVMQALAQASLERLGIGLFAIPSAARAPKAAASPRRPELSLDALHLKTCDLVRRTLLLLNALETRLAG